MLGLPLEVFWMLFKNRINPWRIFFLTLLLSEGLTASTAVSRFQQSNVDYDEKWS